MFNGVKQWFRVLGRTWSSEYDYEEPAARYRILRRNLIILMVLVTTIPLTLMAVINYLQYQKAVKGETVQPLRVMANKTKHSFEVFLAERRSAVSFIASAYSIAELADEKTLNRIFRVMRHEFKGFVDVGLIDPYGLQVSYEGPYKLKGKDYSGQSWFHEVKVRGNYISDVFMGYRKFPHIVIAVEYPTGSGDSWILRATIDTTMFDDLIAAMGLDPESDAFLINHHGVLQTNSKFYGGVLDQCPLRIHPVSYETNVIEQRDNLGRDILVGYTYFIQPAFVLMVVKPRSEMLRAWYSLKSELFFVFLGSVLVIFLVVFRLMDIMVRRIREADQKREEAFREIEHTHKLSSIGRLAAGVAHEINNPLAIINEKAGLMRDLLEHNPSYEEKNKFLANIHSILHSVDRCRAITHRLLGFARRMEVDIDVLDLNEVIKEVLDFLEKEALYRNIQLRLQLAEDLPKIASDRGQLQQVFLNILNNAFAAVDDGGTVGITTWEVDPDSVAVSIQDDGCGMSEETMKNIFEPFFTTKREYGTGLGLPITYGIVKKLGGDIKVQSQMDEGTTFTVYLPKKSKQGSGA